MPAGPTTGHNMKFYVNSATVASPTWVLVSDIEDLNMPDITMGTASLKRRGSAFSKALPTLIQEISVEFTAIYIPGNANLTTFRTALLAGTPKQYAIFNDLIATVGSEGWKIPAIVTEMPWSQPHEDVSKHEIKLALAYMVESAAEVEPAWAVIAS